MSEFSVPTGMPRSVWENKYARKLDGTGRQGNARNETGFQSWSDRVSEVVQGNFLLDPRPRKVFETELEETLALAKAGIMPFSGRHLQHGDLGQPDRIMESYTNCSTAIFSFIKFWLLLKGSGVGRCYDSDLCRVDWSFMPNTRFVLDENHPDFEEGIESLAEAKHKYDSESEEVRWFEVEDSGEGWVKVVEILETAAFQHKHENKLFIFDFSKVRGKGVPIKGQQGRPASGPVPFIRVLKKVASIKGAGMKPWKQAMFIDHYLSSCVAVGGIRRCLPAGTLVQAESGLIPIETVKIGCQVKTSKGFSTVTDTLDQGIQTVSRIITQMGSFDCTKDHRVAVMLDYKGNYIWKKAGELKSGDRLVFPSHEIPGTKTSLPEFSYVKPKHSTTCVGIKIPELTPEIAWFLGLFAGDGYISEPAHRGYGAVALHQDQLDIKERAQNALNSFGISSSYKKFEGKQARLDFKSQQLGIFLREYIKRPNEALKVPEFILQGLPSIRAAYVAGLFDADGSSSTRPLQVVSSVYKSYVVEVQALLVSLGIASVIKEKKRKEKGWKTIYILSVKGETFKEHFAKKVSCFSSKFSVGNVNVTRSSHAYGFPSEWIDFPDKHKWSPRNPQMLTETFTKITGQDVSLFPIEVLEVKLDCYECPTFDITVEAEEFSLGSGILVHNSARIATKSWRDKDVIEFIDIKRVESEKAKLYTANNSVTVDAEFWEQALRPEPSHARRVFEAAVGAAYFDKTGEPGFLNVDLLTNNETGLDKVTKDNYISSEMSTMLNLHDRTMDMIDHTLKWAKKKKYKFIVNPCVTADTWVNTSHGPRQVQDLINKPFTAVVNGKEYKASGFWETGIKTVYEVKTARGYKLKATANHKLLVETSRKQKYGGGYNTTTEWVAVGDLSVGNNLVLSNNCTEVARNTVEFDNGWLLGEIVGDGGHNPEKYPSYVRFWGEHKESLASLALGIAKRLPNIESSVPFGQIQNCGETSQVATRRLDSLASAYVSPGDKELLPSLEMSSESFVSGFLRGLFDADGSVQGSPTKGRSIRLAQSSLPRLESIQRMLLRFGIASSIYKRREEGKRLLPNGKGSLSSYPTKMQYELVISKSNIFRFSDIIGFYDPSKQKKLVEIIDPVSRKYEERFISKISAITKLPEPEAVYDCTVEEAHCFDANGIVAHNCGEIVLNIMGGYCVIGDICLSNVENKEDAIKAARLMSRFLMRVNRMTSLYKSEVERTNRIGVGLTGIHEFAYQHFGLTFWDLINEEKSFEFWAFVDELRRSVENSAVDFSEEIGCSIPHTFTTIKPSGTVSKVMNCTEGAHLPAMPYYIRWVQYALDDPAVEDHRERGYPIKDISKQYAGHCVIGFPTKMPIADIMGDKVVVASEVPPSDQYEWLRLLEKYWLGGSGKNNQTSYTLKYRPEEVDYSSFSQMILENQSTVRACSVMPSINESAYIYVPEEQISKERYEELISQIDRFDKEAVDSDRLDCEGGACPIEFDINES